jgi:signal peptidase I
MSTTGTPSDTPAMSVFWENVRTILYALALAMLLRFTIAQPFRIPSGSMQPTLQVGDYVVVTKWSYGYGRYSFAPLEALFPHGRLFSRAPQRGDIVVFRPPPDTSVDFIKRVVGMPGDHIQMINGVLYINGAAVPRQRLTPTSACPDDPSDGASRPAVLYRETLPNGVSYLTCVKAMTELDNTREYIVPPGNYFMMGDDRENSDDSRRFVGFVPAEYLVGPAQFVVVSFNSTANLFQPWTLVGGFRGNRFLKPLH